MGYAVDLLDYDSRTDFAGIAVGLPLKMGFEQCLYDKLREDRQPVEIPDWGIFYPPNEGGFEILF
jgi:hypothetical protein